MSVAAIIVAAGRGARLGGPLPKQYRRAGNAALLRHAVLAFATHPAMDRTRVVINPADRGLYDDALAGLGLGEPVAGGANRQESVRLGLESLDGSAPPERVLIHDGARPLVSAALIDRVIAALDRTDGALPALAVADSLKRGANGRVAGAVERTGLWRAQTPQGFRFAPILAAHRAAAGSALGDDVEVAERAGMEIALVAGDEDNFKVTTAPDLERVERLLYSRLGDIRVGAGFDVHPFCAGDQLTLCGLSLAHDRGLAGHSDADVGLHALTDAILGALGAGDIGQHFPPSDARWRGAASDIFARHAAELVAARGGQIGHADVTLICEAPKIGPHRAAMVARVAEILGIAPTRVSVKATTTEGLGFTGRGEGIAAQATVTLRLPLSND